MPLTDDSVKTSAPGPSTGCPSPLGDCEAKATDDHSVCNPIPHRPPPRRDPRTGRYALLPEEEAARQARLEALRPEFEASLAAGRLPPSLASLWREELGLLVDALRLLTPNLSPTTAKGGVSRTYKDYVFLVERAAHLCRLLGLDPEAAKPAAPTHAERLAIIEATVAARRRGEPEPTTDG